MYKLLIVDDEKMVREGLQDIIAYLNIDGISPLLTAGDGAEALKVMEAEEPPILLTDLNMPVMGGLDLIRTLRDRHQVVKIIVISGYDDFHLVKESFKLGVRDYLLKPVHSGDLAEVLNKTVQELQQEKQQDMAGQLHKKLALLEKASRSLNPLLQSAPHDNEAIRSALDELGYSFPHSATVAAILSVSNPASHEPSGIGSLERKLLAIEWGQPGLLLYPFYNRHNDLVMWINYNDQICDKDNIRKLLESLLADTSGAAALSAPHIDGGLSQVYLSALAVLQYKLIAPRQRIILHEDTLNKVDISIKAEHLKTLVEMIDMGRREQVLPLIQTYFGEETLKKSSMESIRHNYDMIMQTIGWIPGQKRDFASFDQSETLRLYLKSCMLQMIEARGSLIRSNDVVDIAKKYVQEQLLSGVNMAFIANYCNMSYNYFSKVFKESTGVSFQDYVTMKRMEYARSALTGINVKIHDVAEALGYSNPKNFTRVFKSYFGVSPKEFQIRERQ
jgi:YesN/AraC family two-component response regulator